MQAYFYRRNWRGVPGVRYPVAQAAEKVEEVVPEGWLTMAEAAQRCGLSRSAFYDKVRARGIPVRRALQVMRTRAPGVFCRRPVQVVCWREVLAAVAGAPPPGYVDGAELRRRLRRDNSTFTRWAAGGKLRSVLCFDPARRRICRFYCAADVAALEAPLPEYDGWLTSQAAAEQLGVSAGWLTVLARMGVVRGRLVKGRGRPYWLVEPGSVAAEVLRRRGLRVNAENEYELGDGK